MTKLFRYFVFRLLLFGAVTLTTSPACALDVDEPSITGYAYLQHSEGPDLWTVGNVFTIVTVADIGDLQIVPLDDTVNEYTVLLENLRVASLTETTTNFIIQFEYGMIFSAYEDSRATGTPADFGISAPPNATVPASFVDGTLLAQSGTASDEFELRIRKSNNTGFFYWYSGLPLINCVFLGPGFSGFFEIVGDVLLPESDINPPVVMPAPGYVFRLFAITDCDSPVQDEGSTWGRMKSLYR